MMHYNCATMSDLALLLSFGDITLAEVANSPTLFHKGLLLNRHTTLWDVGVLTLRKKLRLGDDWQSLTTRLSIYGVEFDAPIDATLVANLFCSITYPLRIAHHGIVFEPSLLDDLTIDVRRKWHHPRDQTAITWWVDRLAEM